MLRNWTWTASLLVLVGACGTRTGLLTAQTDEHDASSGGAGGSGGTGVAGTGGVPDSGPTPTPVTCEGSPWSTSFGSAESLESGVSVTANRDCEVIATGIVRGTVDLGAGPEAGGGMYLVKYSPSGQHLWSNLLGDDSGNLPADVAVDANGDVVLAGHIWEPVDFGGGTLSSAGAWDVFVAKYRYDGLHLWSQRFGDADYQHATSVATDSKGNIVVAGYFAGALDLGGGPMKQEGLYDAFVAKLDPDGKHLWSLRIGDDENQGDVFVAIDPDDNVWITGRFQGSVDLGGGVLSSKGGSDFYVAQLDADGSHMVSRAFGGAGFQIVNGIAVNPGLSQVVLVGDFRQELDFGNTVVNSNGEDDAFVAVLDTSLESEWVRTFGDDRDQGAESVAVGPDGILVAGGFEGSVEFDNGIFLSKGRRDIFVALLSFSGLAARGSTFGDEQVDRTPSIAVDPTGGVIVTGAFEGGLSWDPPAQPLESAGETDAFLIRRGPTIWSD